MRSRKAFYATLWAFILWGSVMADWSLKDMGQAYIDENVAEEIVQLDSSNYVPVKYNALCEENAENLKACQPGARKLKILLIDQLPVMATQLGCGKRIFHMLESLVGLGHEVTMAYLRPDSHETEHDQNLIRRLNVPIKYSPLLLGDIKEDYKKLLEETQPDVLLMTLWYWQTDKPWFNAPGLFAVYTRKMLPATKQIIITDDVHWLRLERLADSRKASGLRSRDSSAMSPEAQVAAIRLSEYQVYSKADAVITISDRDRQSILRYDTQKDITDTGRIHVVPFVASPWETLNLEEIPDFINRRGLIFVGNLANPTNIEGLRWFLKFVLPILEQRIPTITLTIVGGGKWPIPEVQPTHASIRWLGWLPWENMRQELNAARVFVSPIVVSTGVNTKNSLAMSNGVPLVTTVIGAAGLCGRCDSNPVSIDAALDSSGEGGFHAPANLDCPFVVASDHEEFVRAVLELYHDEIIWNMFSKRGVDNAKQYLSVRNGAKNIEEIFLKVQLQ